jgi:EAL domain-containing protein (putative c-di-GMP-specific phosphodiesterase class I)
MENVTGIRSVIFEDINSFCEDKSRYRALCVNVHKISEKCRTSVAKNELENMFLPLIKDSIAKTFVLPNEDFLVVYNKTNADDVSSLLVKIQFLFQEDETVKNSSDLQKCGVAVFYDLASEYDALCKKIEASFEMEKQQLKPLFFEGNIYKKDEKANKKLFTTELLSKVQKIISVSDFSSFIRRQAVCAVIGKSAPQRVFEEVFVSVEDVRDSLMPGINVNTNPWLKLALSETLNKRVLEVISRHEDGDLLGNFSVNINVSSILSDEFIQFDDSINGSMRSTIILELQLEDIFSDMNSYILAKTFAKARGYKVCIDGINIDKLKYIKREKLDCDLMKIDWHHSLIDMFTNDEHFMDYQNKAERAKIIFCNIEEPQAIEAGNNLGINLYQGRYIQRMLSDKKPQ